MTPEITQNDEYDARIAIPSATHGADQLTENMLSAAVSIDEASIVTIRREPEKVKIAPTTTQPKQSAAVALVSQLRNSREIETRNAKSSRDGEEAGQRVIQPPADASRVLTSEYCEALGSKNGQAPPGLGSEITVQEALDRSKTYSLPEDKARVRAVARSMQTFHSIQSASRLFLDLIDRVPIAREEVFTLQKVG